jgi:uncharacterized OsmC-like protein
MRIFLTGDTQILVQPTGAELEIESATPDVAFSPLHMLAASLATCTLSVIYSWALQAGLQIDDLEIGLIWEYVEDPYRVGSYDMSIRWPSLPAERRQAAQRVAEHCTVEHTLRVPPEISVGIAESGTDRGAASGE